MQSLLDLYNMREGKRPGSDLLEFYQGNGQPPEPQFIDRATFLPIGQYEDGSLTLAWPEFLKDAYEGATRSLVAQEGSPIFDDGGQYVSGANMQPLDAFNAASLGPVSGVVGRAAGAIPRGALGSGGSDMLSGAKGIRAYHGSPHDFDKFSMEHIGKGEGAQAYGHGLYFAESEGVARSYRDALGKPRHPDFAPEYDDALMWLERMPDRQPPPSVLKLYADHASDLTDELGRVPSRDEVIADMRPMAKRDGHMYEVNINAQPEQFLDWDAPLYDQGESVRNAMEQFRTVPGAQDLWSIRGHLRTGLPGSSAVNHLAKLLGGPEHVSSKLKEAGVPGVRYRDAGSRWNGQTSYDDPTRNYVVFDDSLIDIMRKYANPETASLPYLMTNGTEGDQVANADPAYDANALVDERWRDKPRIQGEPSSYGFGYIEPPAVFQQERIDPPSMWFRPQPIPPPPLFK